MPPLLREALGRLVELRAREARRVRGQRRFRPCDERVEERTLAGQEAALERGRRRREIAPERALRLLERPHRRADLEARVPEPAQEGLERRRVGRIIAEDQQVHVGPGRELGASVTARGDEREPARRHLREERAYRPRRRARYRPAATRDPWSEALRREDSCGGFYSRHGTFNGGAEIDEPLVRSGQCRPHRIMLAAWVWRLQQLPPSGVSGELAGRTGLVGVRARGRRRSRFEESMERVILLPGRARTSRTLSRKLARRVPAIEPRVRPIESVDVRDAITVVLGGGRGNRLFPLTQERCKPAVPVGGDLPPHRHSISNSLNSGIDRVFVLTQFNSASLHSHISNTYRFDTFGKGYVEILAAEQTEASSDWYQGTADAVRKQLHRIRATGAKEVVILSGDHLYRMDLRAFLARHRESRADVTVGVTPVPRAAASQFGLLRADDDDMIVEFAEKPKDPAAIDRFRYQGGDECLGSMGIYIFKTERPRAAPRGQLGAGLRASHPPARDPRAPGRRSPLRGLLGGPRHDLELSPGEPLARLGRRAASTSSRATCRSTRGRGSCPRRGSRARASRTRSSPTAACSSRARLSGARCSGRAP